jgi:hypothetical protein
MARLSLMVSNPAHRNDRRRLDKPLKMEREAEDPRLDIVSQPAAGLVGGPHGRGDY